MPDLRVKTERINWLADIQRRACGLRDEKYLRLKVLTRMRPEL